MSDDSETGDAKYFNMSNVPKIFVELDTLERISEDGSKSFNPLDANCYHWTEVMRIMKFEQNYDQEAKRFTAAHVSPLNYKLITDFRDDLKSHLTLLDVNHKRVEHIFHDIASDVKENGALLSDMEKRIFYEILTIPRFRSNTKKEFKDLSSYQNFQENLGYNDTVDEEIHTTITGNNESCVILTGELNILTKPIMKLVRLKTPISEPVLCELKKPIRFIFICMGPCDRNLPYDELGRCFAVMMKNRKFRAEAYEAMNGEKLQEASNSFLETSIVLPMIKDTSAEALAGMAPQIKEYQRNFLTENNQNTVQPELLTDTDNKEPEGRVNCWQKYKKDFCPPCILLLRNIKPYFKKIPKDFNMFTKTKAPTVLSAIIILYFVCLGPIITLGTILDHTKLNLTNTIVGNGILHALFSLFAGQSMAIVGVGAVTFIIESTVMKSAREIDTDVTILRFWVGIYGAMFGAIFLFFNVGGLVKHIRVSVEEIFVSYIGFFFALKAVFSMFKLIKAYDPSELVLDLANSNNTIIQNKMDLSRKNGIAGATLFLGITMAMFCLTLASFKRGNYFLRSIRKFLGAFNVPIGMCLVVFLERVFFRAYNLPTLPIAPSDKINPTLWTAPVNFDSMLRMTSGQITTIHSVCIPLGLALTILIFTQSTLNGITSIKSMESKNALFGIDYILILIIFPIISGTVGWPYVSGAPVRTVAHIAGLAILEKKPRPGVSPKVLGIVEQRISGTISGLLVALSVCLGSILKWIPIAALYGLFLHMGISAIKDLTFVRRCIVLFKRRKHWEDWDFIRGIPTAQTFVFTLVELFFVGILIILNILNEFTTASVTALLFPLVIFTFAMVREFLLPCWPWLNKYLNKLDKKYKVEDKPKKRQIYPSTNDCHSQDPSWEVNRSKAIDVDPTEFMNIENYKKFLASYSGKEKEEYSDEEDQYYLDTWVI